MNHLSCRVALIGLLMIGAPAFAVDIYVSDAGNFSNPPWQILKFDENGENPVVFIDDNLAWPQDIVFLESAGTVLISNLNSGRIDRYDANTGDFIDVFASGLSGPTRMKIGADDLLYVLQWSGNGRVKRYQLDGSFVDDFTSVGVTQSIGMDWDSAGNLYVSSFSGRSVRRFNSAGQDMGMFVNSNLAGPTNIWFNDAGELLVSDYSGTAIQRFSASGVYMGEFIGGLRNSEGVDSLPNGNLLIGNGATRSVKMYDSNGVYIEDIIPRAAGGLMQPNAVVVRTTSDGFAINAGLNDAWYNPETSGQGFLISVFPDIQQMFLAWFTYDAELPAEDVTAVLGDPGHRWLTAQGPYSGSTADLTIFVSEGGVFDSTEPAVVTDPAGDGRITIQFNGCASGTVSYEITSAGLSGSVPIERIVADNAQLCEALQSESTE